MSHFLSPTKTPRLIERLTLLIDMDRQAIDGIKITEYIRETPQKLADSDERRDFEFYSKYDCIAVQVTY
jgi:hypothetical protein